MGKVTITTASRSARPKPRKHSMFRWLAGAEFGKTYLALAIVVLLVTTVFWALLGARLNQGNADQLADPYLFSHWATFHTAQFPGAHTFLIKWPLFALVGALGISDAVLNSVTVLLVVGTVGALALMMYRIERRPLVIGTLFLALAATLLLVPAQPYAGGILPVNMAMLATRNLEYVVFVASLVLLTRGGRFRSFSSIGAIILLTSLIASDKLFLSLSLGGAILSLIVHATLQKWRLVTLSVRWLWVSAVAGAAAVLLLAAINLSGLTHIVNDSSASPYALVRSAKEGILAVIYAVLGVFTNFGANPAFDATQLRELPAQIFNRLTSLAGPAYVVNALVVLAGLIAVARVGVSSLSINKPKLSTSDRHYDTALLLGWSSIAALGVFVATNHYYAVDARYVSVFVFAVFISLAVTVRKLKWRPERWTFMGLGLLVAIVCGIPGALNSHHRSREALQPIDERNNVIAQVLSRHHVDTLVGDYWRVLPVQFISEHRQAVTPLADCTTPRQGLSSASWQPDLKHHSFAYLISLDRSLTDFPKCSLVQAIKAYGHPNTSVLIAGDVNAPKELLLFYDRGLQPRQPGHALSVISTVGPVQISGLRNTTCDGATVLSIVAHQDDDLLFMNPDLLHNIAAGDCVRTVYLTAGDGGHDKFYWLSREQGSEAAYDTMIGMKTAWFQQTVQLPGKQYINVASPIGDPKVSLIFLHLPDGNLTGHGFRISHFESLQALLEGRIHLMHTVDRQSSYTASELETALQTLMQIYQPAQIRAQATTVSQTFPDHSDHLAASYFAQKAYEQYEQAVSATGITIPLIRYTGYPVRDLPPNVTDGDLAKKQAAFFAYARFDGAVCYSIRDCSATPTYWNYLQRQYTEPTQ